MAAASGTGRRRGSGAVGACRRWRVVVFAILAAVAGLGCGGDLLLSVNSLQVSPNPAQSGQSVLYQFNLTVVPEHNFDLVTLIDDAQHSTENFTGSVQGPFQILVGDATDLIAQYGAGTHRARVEIRLLDNSSTARSGETTFELQQ